MPVMHWLKMRTRNEKPSGLLFESLLSEVLLYFAYEYKYHNLYT